MFNRVNRDPHIQGEGRCVHKYHTAPIVLYNRHVDGQPRPSITLVLLTGLHLNPSSGA